MTNAPCIQPEPQLAPQADFTDPAPAVKPLVFDPEVADRHLQVALGQSLKTAHLRAIHWDGSRAVDLPPGHRQNTPEGLTQLQADGFRLYVIAGGGRSDADVQELHAAFAEWDGLPPAEVLAQLRELGASGLPDPTLLLTTWEHGSVHIWWRFDKPVPVAQWRQLMRRLVLCLNSDSTCINPSRLMRLAGSVYIGKAGDPRQGEALGRAKILAAESTGQATTLAELQAWVADYIAARPELQELEQVESSSEASDTPATKAERAERQGGTLLPPRSMEQVEQALPCIPRRVSGLPDGDYWKYPRHRLIACGLRDALYRIRTEADGLEPEEAARQAHQQAVFLMEQHSPSAECVWNVAQVLSTSRWLDEGCFWKAAIKAGWDPTWKVSSKIKKLNTGYSAGAAGEAAEAEGEESKGPRRLLPHQVLKKLPEALGATPRLNLRSQEVQIGDEVCTGNEVSRLYLRLSSRKGTWPKETTSDAVLHLATTNSFDPVRDYLERVGAERPPLPMEQWQRLDKHLLGIDDPIAARFLPQFLIGAVARTFEPGCGIRRTPVLIGPQWRGKTALGRILFGAEHWVEGLQGANDRDMRTRCHTGWGVELAELNGITRRQDQEHLKAFLTERDDVFRRAYARGDERCPRRFVFWGTSNGPPLRDMSGSTRFVCIPLPDQRLPLDWATKHRDSLWARAVEQYRAGVQWDEATEQERQALAERNSDFQELDPWTEEIAEHLDTMDRQNRVPVKITELLREVGLKTEQFNHTHQKRVREIAESLGWQYATRRLDKKTRKGLWPPLRTDAEWPKAPNAFGERLRRHLEAQDTPAT